MLLVSENAQYVCFWTSPKKDRIKIVSKARKRRGEPYTAYAYMDKMGRFTINSRFPISVVVENWCHKALTRGIRWR